MVFFNHMSSEPCHRSLSIFAFVLYDSVCVFEVAVCGEAKQN